MVKKYSSKGKLIADHTEPNGLASNRNLRIFWRRQFALQIMIIGQRAARHVLTEDEMFFVVKGRFRMDYREVGSEREEWIEPGEFIVVPRGVEHRPVAEEECEVLLFEPASTLNTGNVQDEFTRKKLEKI